MSGTSLHHSLKSISLEKLSHKCHLPLFLVSELVVWFQICTFPWRLFSRVSFVFSHYPFPIDSMSPFLVWGVLVASGIWNLSVLPLYSKYYGITVFLSNLLHILMAAVWDSNITTLVICFRTIACGLWYHLDILRILHYFLVQAFLQQVCYCFGMFTRTGWEYTRGAMVYDIQLPFEVMTVRRQYALELWLALSALLIYLGLTEFRPLFNNEKVAKSN